MMLFAQTAETAAWSGVIAAVVQSGFAALVAWYLLTKAIPQILESFAKIIREERDIARSIEERRAMDSKEKLSTVVNEHKATMQIVVTHCERETTRRDDAYLKEMSLMTSVQRDVGEVLEEVRDNLREIRLKNLSDDTPQMKRRPNAGPASA